jgi:hypothetical protein
MHLSSSAKSFWWVAALLGFCYFYFYSGGGPNQGSRFNLDRAILEEGRVKTNSYYQNSEDRAHFRGNYYCDKAPGTSLTALPALVVTRPLMRLTGIVPESPGGLSLQMHIATWSAATLPAVLMCLCIYVWAVRRGSSRIGAAYSALALGLASPFWAYGTLFWGNALAAFCLVVATRTSVGLIRQRRNECAAGSAVLAGAVTGWAVLTEFSVAPMAVMLFVLLVVMLRPWHVYWCRLALFAAGALSVACVLGTYNQVAFGSPFLLGYSNVDGFEGMKQGAFGVSWPKVEAIAGVIWGPRGLLLTAPILVLGLVGHVVSIIRRKDRLVSLVCVAFSIYPMLLNTSYVYWDGGWTYGPRHMSAALPFMALGLAPLYDSLSSRLRPAAVGALLVAIFLTMIAVGTHGMTPYNPSNPLVDLYWPAFLTGRFVKHMGWTDAGGPAINLGLALGFAKAYSLIPLWIGMGIGLVGLARSLVPRVSPPTDP